MILSSSRERSRFLRFAMVGTIGAVVDFGVMNLLVNLVHAPLVVAGAISFVAAIVNNFVWNRYWTYPDSRSKSVRRQLVMFTVVSVIGLVIRVPTLALLEPVMLRVVTNLPFRIPFLPPKVLGENLTLAIAVLIVMFWNFFVNRFWTYNDVE